MARKQRKNNKKSFWHRIRFKYKLSFFNETTLEEVWSFRLSQLSAFLSLALFAFFLIAVTALIIIKTPIRNYLPGYLDVEIRKEIMQNALRADSLERMISIPGECGRHPVGNDRTRLYPPDRLAGSCGCQLRDTPYKVGREIREEFRGRREI